MRSIGSSAGIGYPTQRQTPLFRFFTAFAETNVVYKKTGQIYNLRQSGDPSKGQKMGPNLSLEKQEDLQK